MKLSDRKQVRSFDRIGYYQGRYKTFVIKITEGANSGWGTTGFDHYWIMFDSIKYDKTFNSLWMADSRGKFNNIEEAKEFAINWVDNYVKEWGKK